ncbi:MAG: OmpA family protein [Hydrogenovibrio sp.]|nr:OmpA family protein [Hydrogenovibrio sp.]
MLTRTILLILSLSFLPFVHAADSTISDSAADQALKSESASIEQNLKRYRDLDEDGVPDKRDVCPNSAKGYAVDKDGCELDSDHDGVYDRIDQCPNTAPGTPVNFLGCEGDSDKDGVLDSRDKCPMTPLNTPVNQYGCKVDNDADGDGVPNSMDQCPKTPKGKVVNKFGCQPQTKLTMQITFAVGSWNIPTNQKKELEQNASKLKQLRADEVVLITGYTDASGGVENNLKLSWERANSVKNYILSNFSYAKEQFYILGKGESNPIASNATKAGRKQNRRIEFQVINIKKLPKSARNSIPADMRLAKQGL